MHFSRYQAGCWRGLHSNEAAVRPCAVHAATMRTKAVKGSPSAPMRLAPHRPLPDPKHRPHIPSIFVTSDDYPQPSLTAPRGPPPPLPPCRYRCLPAAAAPQPAVPPAPREPCQE